MRADPISDPDGEDVELRISCPTFAPLPTLQGTLVRGTEDKLSGLLPCTEVAPGSAAIAIVFEITLNKTGGSPADEATLYVDSTNPFNCSDAVQITGPIVMTPLLLDHDQDEDGCTDWYELGANSELGGLNDPFNPDDCDGVPGGADELDAYGLYDVSYELGGGYRRCKLSVTQMFSGLVWVLGKAYCYTDVPGADINPEAYAGTSGDGLPGAPPPGPEHPPGSGNLAFGDVDEWHAFLIDRVVGGTLQPDGTYVGGIAKLEGCFEDLDGQDPLGHVIVRWEWDVQTGAGTSDTWTHQALADCTWPPTPVGEPYSTSLQALKLATAAQSDACYDVAGVCPFADTDGDGVPDAAELQDDILCGRRDPFNPYDYYDVSIPRDGVIDLPNDILGVIQHFAPGGYDPGDENWDRPPVMAGMGAGSHWNRGSPDGVIDLPNDINGVILQTNPSGCSPP